MDYKDLKLRIIKVYDTQKAFAVAMGMSRTALNQRLNGLVEWKTSEIIKACELLDIPISEAHTYFFIVKVQIF